MALAVASDIIVTKLDFNDNIIKGYPKTYSMFNDYNGWDKLTIEEFIGIQTEDEYLVILNKFYDIIYIIENINEDTEVEKINEFYDDAIICEIEPI